MRQKRVVTVVIALLSLALASGCCRPPLISSVAADHMVPQHRDWWCWAASTEMISEYYGHTIPQCESANFVHGTPPDCCTGCSGDCPCWGSDWGATLGDIENNWTHFDFDYEYKASNLSWTDLKETISTSSYCLKSPIQVVWWWTLGGGHVVTAYGYAEAGGEKYVAYFNPLPEDCATSEDGCEPVPGGEEVVSTYDAFVSDGVHTWGNSFYDFKYTGP